ncbi:winged helix-turn-helix domain-containing protein [Phenylobacterium montanum]|uniref:Winged helix-turn-helix domain-containing protein n=1 Tax=Phenylobacterium montanum TaxID=2823693 RepID=A0A975IV58_9CAUL|nr:winged helix-turn-helix domain-containing protein [Caulobacter sp. S6]QUD88652.1 winged helix-turn-helix domain-containing protein [Caulobacter sp. S6]
MDILLLLASRPGELVTKDEIQQRLWPGIFVDEASVRVHMSSLRKALSADGLDHIHTVAGRGYIFVSPVTWSAEPEPASAPQAHPHLPSRLERLIGRATVVDGVAAQILERRFVTIVGPGGIGKTSVALEVAGRLADEFADGVRFVDLATLEDPETAPGALAIALGLPVLSELSPGALAKPLAGKRLLIVLDNCERLAEAAATVAEAMLRATSGICVLATSREALRAEGEWLHRLPPLATPASTEMTPSAALRYSAVELFVDRVDAAVGGYRLSPEDCTYVVEICRRLDGLPLAIELAATTVAALGVRGVAEGLDDRLALLTGGRRTAQSRHQTLRAAHDWSYDLLSPPEQRVLNSLSVVAGGFDLALACAVADDPATPPDKVRSLVGALSGKSLIAVESGGRSVRYRLLESTKVYAIEKLQVSGHWARAARNYAEATLASFLGAADEWARLGSDAWLALHASRLEDARAVLEWAFSEAGDRSLARKLTAELSAIWLHMGLVRECLSWCRRAMTSGPQGAAPDASEMKIQHAYGIAHSFTHGTDQVTRSNIAATIDIAQSLGNHDYAIRGLWALASSELNEGELELALVHAAQLRDAADGAAAAAERLVGERIYGSVLHLLGRHAEARIALERARDAYGVPGQRASATRFQFDQLVLAQGFLAMIAWIEGDETGARLAAEAAVAEAVSVDHAGSLGFALDTAITLAILRGDLADAERASTRLGQMGANVGFEVWMIRGEILRAIIQVRSGDLSAGLPRLQASLAPPRRRMASYRAPLFLAELAQAEAAAGLPEKALATIDDAIDWFRGADAFWCAPECYRVKAAVLRTQGGPNATREAEALLSRAFGLAQSQGAVGWQQRISTAAV